VTAVAEASSPGDVAAALVDRTRAAQGLPPRIVVPAVVAQVAAVLTSRRDVPVLGAQDEAG
jgi:hypothetical protein